MQRFDVVVVGTGFAGLYLIKACRDAGFSVRAYETADGVGGTWYWNRYPGARCDLESFDYSYTFSPELQQEWSWSERYPSQPEILRYLNFVADRFALREHIRLQTTVESAIFDESQQEWIVSTTGGGRVAATFCVMATGVLSVPKPPEIPGLESFSGRWFHTGRWPHEGVDFTGQKVAILGTGSSGVQCAPIVAEQAAQLTVFQRTPNYTVPAINYPLDDARQAEYRNTARERCRLSRQSRFGIPAEFPTESALAVDEGTRLKKYEDAWTNSHLLAFRMTYSDILTSEAANSTVARFLQDKIRGLVKDRVTAETLIPKTFPFGTKRPCLGSAYYPMFNRSNVRLVDLRQTPIERFTPTGLQTTAESMTFDSIIFATGFDALTGAVSRIDVRGRGGLRLREKWADGPRAYLGLGTHGFPNLFLVTGPGSPGPLSNMVVSIEQHVEWIRDCMVHVRNHGFKLIEATAAAEIAWVDHVQQVVSGTLYLQANSWYLGANVPGKPRVFMPYLGGAGTYRNKCTGVAENGYGGFELTNAAGVTTLAAVPPETFRVPGPETPK